MGIIDMIKNMFSKFNSRTYAPDNEHMSEDEYNDADKRRTDLVYSGVLNYDDTCTIEKVDGNIYVVVSESSWQPKNRGVWFRVK